ncbi:MAG: glycosyltransferase family 4 protein [Clostridia bacterium]|nr:glycosyltransferase family 4 protein [Clostridia bacterium]
MKILFITTCYPDEDNPQYCVFLEQQAKALFGFSNRVDVLFINEGGTEKKEHIRNGIKVFDYPIVKPKKFEIVIPTSLSKNDFDNVEKIICDNYDIVSIHFAGNKIKRSIVKICKKHNIPFVIHFHGLNVWYEEKEKHKLIYAWYRLQYKMIYKKADAVVGVSSKVCDAFSSKIKTVPAYTVYNGVDVDRFAHKNRNDLRFPLRILCVANLIDLKGQDYLIRAISKTASRGIDCELTLVGKGPNEEKLKELAKAEGIEDRIFFNGVLPYEALPEVMSDNDIFIMPSYYEALGCVYLEAMSSGMITVGVRKQGIDEIIKDGENGYLVSPKSVVSVAAAINTIFNLTGDELSAISDAARKTAEEYTWENSAKALNEVYKKTISAFREDKH